MQSGIDTSHTRVATYQEANAVTRVDIHPDSKPGNLFGEDGPSFRDVFDAVNPLNHIPIVADIFKSATGHTVSVASRMAGGALLGGPIGFVASLASIIFEDATGNTPVQAVYAALTGDAAKDTAMVASNEAAPEKATEEETEEEQVAEAAPVEKVKTQATKLASLSAPVAAPTAVPDGNAVLELYGNSAASAHNSYKKAQLLPYLRDVTTSKVL